MEVIIAGSRSITDYSIVKPILDLLSSQIQITKVISGGANGVDSLGEKWAKENKIKLVRYNAKWSKYGKKAGMIRNQEMLEVAQGCIVIFDGNSKGSLNMVKESIKRNLKFWIWTVKSS